MSIEILYHFYWISFTFDLDLVRLHSLLNYGSNISKSNIDSCFLQASVSSIFNCFKKLIISWIKSNSKGCIDNSSIDMSPKINFADIIISKYCIISRVWSIMSSTMVDGATCWKGNTRPKSIFWGQLPVVILELFANISQSSSRFYDSLSKSPNLPLDFSTFS